MASLIRHVTPTQGNPYLLEQLIEGFDQQTGQFQAVSLCEIIDRRLERLPEGAISLLEAIAIAGQAVTLEEAASVAQQSSQAFSTITHMRSERLVRLIGSGQQQLVDTYHDKIRESVLVGIEDSRRREALIVNGAPECTRTWNIAATRVLVAFNGRSQYPLWRGLGNGSRPSI
jgi:predicted NBD/HSP70 family sugar kinase